MKSDLSVIITIGALTLLGCKPSDTGAQKPVPPSAQPGTATRPTTARIEAEVRKIVAEQLGIAAERIQLTSTWQQLGADSLDCVELTMAFEEKFNLEIPDEQAATIKTVGDAITFLSRHSNQ